MEVSETVEDIVATSKLTLREEVIEDTAEKKLITRYTPLGVVVGIVPWNYPISTAASKLVPAVLTGNAVIIKPSCDPRDCLILPN